MPPQSDIPANAVPSAPVRGPGHKGVFWSAVAALVGLEGYLWFNAEVRDPLHLPLGLAILFFATLPGLLWARRGLSSLPIFEVLLLTTANAYAFPLLNGHRELIYYSPEDVTTAALAVLLFQVVAIAVYEICGGRPSTHPFWRDEIIAGDVSRWLSYGMVLNTGYVLASTFTTWIPNQLESILRAIFFGVGIVCTFIMSRRLGARQLTAGERAFFVGNLAVQCVGMMSTLFLVGAVSTLLLALVGYVSSSGRLPLVIAGSLLLGIAVLHNGKPEMRARYWEPERRTPTVTELPAFFQEWIGYGIRFRNDEEGRIAAKLIDRTSLFHLMCLVVSTTPAQQPFLEGETYRDIPAQFVPRIFWPEKPLGHVSTSRLAVYYGLQTEEDTQKTTIGFGMLTEAYANFGFYGVAAVAALLAAAIKKLHAWSAGASLFSYGGLTLVVLLAWSFQTEFTLSIWLASLYQAIVAVLLIPFALRRVFS
ncbi:hypothetical protein DB347_18335 [Opitutaceae bacterium EW11]|nr:hypothetical protein DB347_18335 [Opitutaceae bacterium EW11]